MRYMKSGNAETKVRLVNIYGDPNVTGAKLDFLIDLSGTGFVLALPGIRRLVVQIKAIETTISSHSEG